MKIYIVMDITWSRANIVKLFLDKNKADALAMKMELEKSSSDGYVQFYVKEYEVE